MQCKKMTHASLFSGIGGAELAASWMGWTNAFHCEINPFARKILEYHFPNSISYDDITTTDFTTWRGKIDILTGGFPCQPFSVSGKRKGAADDRYLWPQMLRAIREIQPTWIVGENVAGLLWMVQPGEEINVGRSEHLFEENYLVRREQEFTLHAILDNLEQAGYAVQTFVIPACAVGAPHRRDRVWIVAHRADAGTKGLQREGKDGVCEPRFASDIDYPSISGKCIKRQRQEKPNGRDCENAYSSANANCIRLPKWNEQRKPLLQQGQHPQTLHCQENIPDFSNFQTQSPICSRNDGLSDRLDTSTISFPKWREESVKAYGNAWVPQVAYEIFKAIQQVEDYEP